MAPNLLGTSALFIAEATANAESLDLVSPKPQQITYSTVRSKPQRIEKNSEPTYKWEIVWRNVLGMTYLHLFSFYGLYLFLFVCSWKTFFWTAFIAFLAGQGITAGAHRLWAHRCYKAKLPLRILLAAFQTIAFQNHIYEWVRDHRVHHKFTDTDADPHNAKRGFFFSHVGWLMVRKHKDIYTRGKAVDLSDLIEDPVVRYQKMFYLVLMPLLAFGIPVLVPYYYWNENIYVSWYVAGVFRYTFTLNATWLVNSAAHIYGTKPYDKTIGPTENKFVAAMAFGEGWHNYHHVFPWDYKASELGYHINFTTRTIDFFAKIGWAYDLKTVSKDIIDRRVARTGDGSRKVESTAQKVEEDHHDHEGGIWGWGDSDMAREDIQLAQIHNKLD